MTPTHFVILSGAYCDSELVAEFGRLPPSFLPVGNRRLFEIQAEFATTVGGRIIVSLPSDFIVEDRDEERLFELGIEVLRVPTGLSLAHSLAFVIESLGAEGSLHLLHGDTLVEVEEGVGLDTVCIRTTDDFYEWAEARGDSQSGLRFRSGLGHWDSPRTVACGFFTFSDAGRLLAHLRNSSDFVEALNDYSRECPLAGRHVSAWHDFGHLSRYYRAKRDLLITRSFNHLRCDGTVVTKSSADPVRVEAEASWYESLPPSMRVFTPQYLGRRETSDEGWHEYSLEYLCLPTLADLFVFGRLPRYVWRRILQDCASFLSQCQSYRPPMGEKSPAQFHEKLIVEKTWDRVDSFCAEFDLSPDLDLRLNGRPLPSLRTVVEELLEVIPPTSAEDLILWHGDFCFSNILYDLRAQRLKTIDPRGTLPDGSLSVYGDRRYDRAKLAHSILGRYDAIVAGRVSLEGSPRDLTLRLSESRQIREIQEDFLTLRSQEEPLVDRAVYALATLLFLSMLPLHSDSPSRQLALFANGLQMYVQRTEYDL